MFSKSSSLTIAVPIPFLVKISNKRGKKYLDFVAGIAVFALGYNNKAYNDALKAQIDKVIHTSNYYYNIPAIEAAKKLKKISGMDRIFFTNSGAEAVEGALKWSSIFLIIISWSLL